MSRKTQTSQQVNQFVGTRIRFYRNQSGLSQQELATRCGITYQQLHKYEIGSNGASASRLADIALHLNVRVSDLFQGIDNLGTDNAAKASAPPSPSLNREQVTLLSYLHQIPPQKRQSLLGVMKALAEE